MYEVGEDIVENNIIYVVIMKDATHRSDHLRFVLEVMMKLSEKRFEIKLTVQTSHSGAGPFF